jgi:hypothetical protein
MALQLPALKSIGDSIGMDFSKSIAPPTEMAQPEQLPRDHERRKK